MLLEDLNEFIRLSALLNYQLSARRVSWENVVTIILGKRSLEFDDRMLIVEAAQLLEDLYGQRRRRLGPLALLHPLRATAIYCRVHNTCPRVSDLLVELFHDTREDIHPSDFEPQHWQEMKESEQRIFKKADKNDGPTINEQLDVLTNRPDENYFAYVGRVLDSARSMPELACIKMADRLDNTLDLRIDLEDPLQDVDFFYIIYQIISSRTFSLARPEYPHPAHGDINGANRLFQLFKNIILLSLVRMKLVGQRDDTIELLFRSIARASVKEAQRIVLHIFTYHLEYHESQRQLIRDTLQYVYEGGIECATFAQQNHPIDGLLKDVFENKRNLTTLYEDKPLMVQASLAFICIFLRFLNDPEYRLQGVCVDGIQPVPGEAAFLS